jgi:hypothetical protein
MRSQVSSVVNRCPMMNQLMFVDTLPQVARFLFYPGKGYELGSITLRCLFLTIRWMELYPPAPAEEVI